jgi:hypothetical protein
MDKAYVGVDSYLSLNSKVKQKNPTTTTARSSNKDIKSKRIISENIYGQLWSKFKILRDVFQLDHQLLDTVFSCCCSLTNFDLEKRLYAKMSICTTECDLLKLKNK